MVLFILGKTVVNNIYDHLFRGKARIIRSPPVEYVIAMRTDTTPFITFAIYTLFMPLDGISMAVNRDTVIIPSKRVST